MDRMNSLLAWISCLLCVLKTGTEASGWSFQVAPDVTGEVGKPVALLCTFTHPHKNYNGTLTGIWRIGEPYNGMVIFKCVSHNSNDLCKTTVSYRNKYKLLGNPRHNNLSIKIDNLTWSDSDRYFCRVELSTEHHDKYETKTGTRLHLIAPPKILNITVAYDSSYGYSALCTAEGEPLPSLIWTGPEHSNYTTTIIQQSLKHQIIAELHYLAQDGKYTCIAMNSHGKAEGAVYFFKFKSGTSSFIFFLFLSALGVKLLLLFVILGMAAYCGRDNSPAQPHLVRQHVQESTYENFDQKTYPSANHS
ncbi:sialic acid-binding Ig-like lectin 15 [Microcaecilia unicolor]|uniref:Sialic acid-binding Ig-like lectin 15 n=1 Tax=Microcaecilia unicolor TaxID=1415580 RepID=A0A6P7WX22_9AMPH|nr:sialic acid-binding Ig-like lectin 15 [Microcaecilia unicolor]